MTKRAFSRRLFLKANATVAVGLLVAACAPSTPVPSTPAPPTAAATPAPAATAPAATAAPSGKKVKLSISHIGGGTLQASEASDRMKQMRAAFPNVDIENRWVSYSAYVEKIPLIASTGDLADLQFCNAFNDVPTMMDNNLLMETGPLLDKYGKNILAATPKEAWDSTLYDGKQYAVLHQTYDLNVWLSVYRKDWLDKFGMKVPETLDELAAYWKASATKDPNGDGKGGTYGRVLANMIRFDDDIWHAFDVAVGHHFNGFWRDRGGQLQLDWVQPGMKQGWAWLREQWAQKVIDPDSITQQLTYRGPRWQSGMIGMSYSGWTSIDNDLIEIKKTAPKAELVAGPAVKGPNGAQGYTGEGFPWVFVTPKKSQVADVGVQIVDWFFDPKNVGRFICDGEMGISLKPVNEKGWCAEYSLQERKDMGQKWNDMVTAAKDIVQYNGVWMGLSATSIRPWLETNWSQDMKDYFTKLNAGRYSPEALKGYEYATKYMKLTKKKRPTRSEKQYWPGLQARFAEIMDQVVAGTLPLDQGWNDWLSFFEKNGGPTLTTEVNELK